METNKLAKYGKNLISVQVADAKRDFVQISINANTWI